MEEISSPSGSGAWRRWVATATSKYQQLLDITTPHRLRRWVAFGVAALTYLGRVCWIQGFYIITYALGIYILNLMIRFISPQIDPEIQRPPPLLPVHHSHPHPDEFKPFVRLLPEFKLWYSLMKAFCLAFLMTFFPVFDVPVFWPILVVYWIVLFVMTIKRQVLHMIKYRYVPFTVGKQKYGGKKPATQKQVQQQKLEADQLEQPV